MRYKDLRETAIRTVEVAGAEIIVDAPVTELRRLAESLGPMRILLHPPSGRLYAWVGETLHHQMETRLFVAGLEPQGGDRCPWFRPAPDESAYLPATVTPRGLREHYRSDRPRLRSALRSSL